MHTTRTALVALACALVALLGGVWLGGNPQSLPEPLREALVEDERALRAELIETIERSFYKPVDEQELEEASLKGMVRSLDDPFSHYLTPEEAARFHEAVEGEFDGVGMTVEEDPRGLKVLKVFDGAPAARAGIRRGDLVVAVDGRSIAGLNSELATARIKGRPGTRVRLGVVTPGAGRRTLTVTRRRIKIPVADGRIVERGAHELALVELLTFSSGAHGLLRREIDRLLERGAEGIVLDLRGNGGGLLSEAVLVASVFIEDGEIVSIEGRARPERTESARGDAIDPAIPVVVLVDGGSASASEIVTGALRDRDRAAVVGARTYGKGLVQEVEELSNGGVLDLTVATYYLPSGRTIGRRGLAPQVEARDDPSTERDEALPIALDALLERSR